MSRPNKNLFIPLMCIYDMDIDNSPRTLQSSRGMIFSGRSTKNVQRSVDGNPVSCDRPSRPDRHVAANGCLGDLDRFWARRRETVKHVEPAHFDIPVGSFANRPKRQPSSLSSYHAYHNAYRNTPAPLHSQIMSFGFPISSGAGSSDGGSRGMVAAAQYLPRPSSARSISRSSGLSSKSCGSDNTKWEVGKAPLVRLVLLAQSRKE